LLARFARHWIGGHEAIEVVCTDTTSARADTFIPRRASADSEPASA
jgi:hypothetical protein